MPILDSYRWEQEVLGEHIEYPGHPVILACMVMDRYSDLDAAVRVEPGHSHGNALGDRFIPGSGCAVHAALDTLSYVREHGLPAAYAYADRYWQGWERQHPSNAPAAARGREQAERVKARFEAQVKTWGSQEDAGTPYRVQDRQAA